MDARFRQEAPTDLLVAVHPAASRPRRTRQSDSVRRRPAMLLVALLVGGLAAAGFGWQSALSSIAGRRRTDPLWRDRRRRDAAAGWTATRRSVGASWRKRASMPCLS